MENGYDFEVWTEWTNGVLEAWKEIAAGIEKVPKTVSYWQNNWGCLLLIAAATLFCYTCGLLQSKRRNLFI